jgi:hypothetical protein
MSPLAESNRGPSGIMFSITARRDKPTTPKGGLFIILYIFIYILIKFELFSTRLC